MLLHKRKREVVIRIRVLGDNGFKPVNRFLDTYLKTDSLGKSAI